MSISMGAALMAAAQLAGSLSESRRKRIRLILEPKGLLIEGRLFDQSGQRALQEFKLAVAWRLLAQGEAEQAIRMIDARLVKIWRSEGAELIEKVD